MTNCLPAWNFAVKGKFLIKISLGNFIPLFIAFEIFNKNVYCCHCWWRHIKRSFTVFLSVFLLFILNFIEFKQGWMYRQVQTKRMLLFFVATLSEWLEIFVKICSFIVLKWQMNGLIRCKSLGRTLVEIAQLITRLYSLLCLVLLEQKKGKQ